MCTRSWLKRRREGKGREGKGREGKGREEKRREEKRREERRGEERRGEERRGEERRGEERRGEERRGEERRGEERRGEERRGEERRGEERRGEERRGEERRGEKRREEKRREEKKKRPFTTEQALEDEAFFAQYVRMQKTKCDDLLDRIGPKVSKTSTNMRASVKSDLTACYPLVSAILFWFREHDECHASTKTVFFRFFGKCCEKNQRFWRLNIISGREGGGGEGSTPIYWLYGYVPLERVWRFSSQLLWDGV